MIVPILSLFSCADSNDICGTWRWEDGTTSQYLENGTQIGQRGLVMNWEINDRYLTIKNNYYTLVYEILELSDKRIVLKDMASGKKHFGVKIH